MDFQLVIFFVQDLSNGNNTDFMHWHRKESSQIICSKNTFCSGLKLFFLIGKKTKIKKKKLKYPENVLCLFCVYFQQFEHTIFCEAQMQAKKFIYTFIAVCAENSFQFYFIILMPISLHKELNYACFKDITQTHVLNSQITVL